LSFGLRAGIRFHKGVVVRAPPEARPECRSKQYRRERSKFHAPSQFEAGANDMSKERNQTKETKKMPAMTPKEKKAAKKAKKNEKVRMGQ
jgi:hypothetical protein